MSARAAPSEPLTLANCDREPIHIPGSIQPHGALLCVDALTRVTHASANVDAMLGHAPVLGQPLRPAHVGGSDDVHAFILEAVQAVAAGEVSPMSMEAEISGHCVDIVLHGAQGLVVCEFERRATGTDHLTSFAHKAYRLMDGLKRQRSIDRLLETAVEAVRALTGFDRVMAYRFRHDDSGDVVAEARRDDLEAYLGRRYPATDIPAQARRLYVLNTLRLIADVQYEPVPLLAEAGRTEPLDLSHSVLRSVSPIHVEYLRNMGVQASMSVSIVVGGRLWGMLACHHLAPLQVPYSVRMAVDVMAQLLAGTVQTITAQARAADLARAASLRAEIATRMAQGEEALDVLGGALPVLQGQLHGHAALAALEGRTRTAGDVGPAWAEAVLAWLRAQPGPLVQVAAGLQLPPGPQGDLPRYCGLLALRFDGPREGWIVVFRREQVETIRWGGKPDKEIAHGPLGPRLTPRGSFDEWRETVRGTAEPWTDTELEIASELLDAVSRAHAERVLELDKLRSQLWAVLGHDLRNPLQSLSMASRVLDQGDRTGRANRIIRNSADRMERLLRDVLDVSRMQNGLALDMRFEEVDVAALVRLLVEEVHAAHPETSVVQHLPPALLAQVDPGRMSQVVANLLSNARHHGQGGVTVTLHADEPAGFLRLSVGNLSPPIPPEVVTTLFDPFSRRAMDGGHNRTGMGLGLYIVAQVVKGHGGRVHHEAAQGRVTFHVELPLRQQPA